MAARRKTEQERIPCAIYTRVSTAGQIRGEFTSIDSQYAYCKSFIESNSELGWYVLPTDYSDPGFSGSNLNRPGLQRLLADADAGLIKSALVYRYDRLSRDNMEFHVLCYRLESQGVKVVSATEKADSSDPMGIAMRSIAAVMNQLEVDTIKKRTRDKIAEAKRQGRWCGGHVPLGYQVHKDGGSLVVEPEAAKMVKAIFSLYLKLQSLMAVAEELNRRGWLTKRHETKTGKVWGGKPWTKTYVHNHITNVLYIGEVRHKSETYPGLHDAIITKRTWNQAQALLKANCRNGGATTRNKHGHLLRSILYCKSCNAPMNPTVTKRGSRIYRYLVCSSASRKGWNTCPNPSVSAPAIEDFVRKNIAVIGSDPALQQETVRQVRKAMKTDRPALKSERRRLQTQHKKARAEIEQLVAALGNGSSQSVASRLGEVEDLVATIDRRIAEIDRELAVIRGGAVDEDRLADALQQFTPVWDLLFPLEQERLIRLIVERVDYNGKGANLVISYRPTGLMALANEIAEPQEVTA